MKCQSCGRRSPDSNNFCQHCGVIASDETTPAVIPSARLTPVHTQQSTFQPARPRPQQTKPATRPSVPRAARGGSNAFSSLLFWGFLAYGAYWFMSDDQREIREMLMEWIQQQTASQETRPAQPPRRPAQVPRASQPDPGTTAPAGGRASDAPAPRSSTGAARAAARGTVPPTERETVPTLQPRSVPPPAAATPPPPPAAGQRGAPAAASDIEGLSPAQVLQRLGRPSGVVTREGITAWTYQNGTLVVYFVKDRATLKTPR